MQKIKKVIVVDDDLHCLMICTTLIRRVAKDIELLEFIEPEEGIKYIESAFCDSANKCPAILLLDINMPNLNGWEFLEKYENMCPAAKNYLSVYMLSSSIDPEDRKKAMQNANIKGFLCKPFKKQMAEKILYNIEVGFQVY